MTWTRGKMALTQLRMLELYAHDPRITDAEVCRICKINPHTAAKYRKKLFAQLDEIRAKVAITEKEVEQETVGLWQKISKILG